MGEGRLVIGGKRIVKRLTFQGIPIAIETPEGKERFWHDPFARLHGSTRMEGVSYGEIPCSLGLDGDALDVFVGKHEDAPYAYLVMIKQPPDFVTDDEIKVFLGFRSQDEALMQFYLCYGDPRFVGSVQAVPIAEFRLRCLVGETFKSKARRFVARFLRKSRFYRQYYRKDEKGHLLFVREHWDSRDAARPKEVSEQGAFPVMVPEEKIKQKVKPVVFRTSTETKDAPSAPRKKTTEPHSAPLLMYGEQQRAEKQRQEEQREHAAREAMEAAKRNAPMPEEDPYQKDIATLRTLFLPKGVHVREGVQENKARGVEMYGNTYPHLKMFQQWKSEGIVWGRKNAAGYFAWWTNGDRIKQVINRLQGGRNENVGTDTARRGAGSAPGPAISSDAVPGTGGTTSGGNANTGVTPGYDEQRGVSEGASSIRSGGTEQPVRDGQESAPVSSGVRPERRSYRDYTIDELIAVQSPEPSAILSPAVAPLLKEMQQKTVRLMVDCCNRGERGFVLGDGTGTGKAQPLDAKILTPNGWRRMGDLRIGDEVVAVDGTTTEVTGVYPQGRKIVYRVLCSDGATTECCDEHLWLTQTLYERRKATTSAHCQFVQPKIRSLGDIRTSLAERHFLPIVSPVEFAQQEPLPLPAYTLGVLLGDGNMTQRAVTFSKNDSEIAQRISGELPAHIKCVPVTVSKNRCATYRLSDAEVRIVVNGGTRRSYTRMTLESLELMGKKGHEKFIPSLYLFASVLDRIALLQGLLDTDGTIDSRSNSVTYSTSSPRLAEDMIALVRSLGGVATKSSKVPIFTYKGESKKGRLNFLITIALPNDIPPFSLLRKAQLIKKRSWGLPKRRIVDVSHAGMKEVQCISVAHPSQLYVTDDFIVTHNTYTTLGFLKQREPRRALIVVPNQGIAQQWQEVGRTFGLEVQQGVPASVDAAGIHVVTYAKLRDLEQANAGAFDIAIFDEVHQQAMKIRQGRKTARMVADLATASRFSVYSTATPIERPQDAEYLAPVNLWRNQSFYQWSQDHGVRWDRETIYIRGGRGETRQVLKPKFVGTGKGKLHDMLRIRAEMLGAGKASFNELQVAQPLTTTFTTVPLEGGPFSEQVATAMSALDRLPDDGVYAAARVNMAKRLLDYVKLDTAVGDALAAVKEGKHVAVFVSNKSSFQFSLPDDPEETEELSRITQSIRKNFERAGLTGQLQSPTEYLMQQLQAQLGADQVAEYTGGVSDAKRARVKADFQQGKVKVIVASIAAGGTGLSLHDTVGTAPRHQINIGLPWSGKDYFQLVGRTYREGTASPVTQHFLLAEDPYEQRLAKIVAGKSESMGATVRGVVADKNVTNLAQFSVMGMFESTDDSDASELAQLQGEGWKKSQSGMWVVLKNKLLWLVHRGSSLEYLDKAVTGRGKRTGGYWRIVTIDKPKLAKSFRLSIGKGVRYAA